MMGLITVGTASFVEDLLGCLITLVLGTEIGRVTIFVFGLAIFFYNAIMLTIDASISLSAAHFVSIATQLKYIILSMG